MGLPHFVSSPTVGKKLADDVSEERQKIAQALFF
jgi:hypothetical protein